MIPLKILIRKLKNIAHLILAQIATIYFRFPSRSVTVIGVTGTDGKTTTTNFIYQLLTDSGKSAALISTTGVYIGEKKSKLGFHVTTPSPFVLQKFLRKVADKKITYAVIEVSSHAIDQYRIHGIHFDIAVLTNISSEHLDYHRTLENYINTKVSFLKKGDKAIINLEDKSFKNVKEKLGNKRFFTYSITDKKSDFSLASYNVKDLDALTQFNQSNLAAAISTLVAIGIKIDKRITAKRLMLPLGRLTKIQEKPFKVVVDFAHTPNAFTALLQGLRRETRGRLIHVFGSAGKRDHSKRPLMGKEASEYDDIVILTAEDPRNESVKNIMDDISAGITNFQFLTTDEMQNVHKKNKKYLFKIPDRRQAIKFALSLSENADTVVITGKGHEESMNMGHGEIPWSDIAVVKELLKRNGKQN